MQRSVILVPLLACSLACSSANSTEETSTECQIVDAGGLPAPVLLTPKRGELDVDPNQIAVELAAPAADAGRHVGTEIEIWRVAGTEPAVRAWVAKTEDPAKLLTANLDDGRFEGLSQELGFVAWTDYAIRARFTHEASACEAPPRGFLNQSNCCVALSSWSEFQIFRITDGSPTLFDQDVIRDVAIEIGPESFDAINAEARPPGCVPFVRDYYVGNAIVDGERFDGVGVRAKGGCGSSRNLDGKASFKIHLSWDDPQVPGCPETRRHRGLKRLTLNNQVQDRSFTHERIAYHFYELMGIPVPRVAHTRVSVNGELWGLYLHVESIDRRMLSRNFVSSRGALYEGSYRCDLLPQNVPPNLEPDYCIQAKFKPDECDGPPRVDDDPLNYEPIRELTEAIAAIPDGEFYPAITQLVNWDQYLSLWAADSMLNHWDGYTFRIINNFRVYRDPGTDRWSIIPTGVDQTLTTNEVNPFAPDALLATRCLSEAPCEAAFVARLQEAVDIFERADLGARASAIADQIRSEVEQDPRKEGNMNQFDSRQAALQSFIANRPDQVRDYIANR